MKKIENQKSILNLFPKKRAPLPKEYQAIYESHYVKNRDGKTKTTSISAKMERWLHMQVAKDIKDTNEDVKTLEIGAGTLNHLKYEKCIISYDIVEPFAKLYQNSDQITRINNIYSDIFEINPDSKYSRIISIATFEHIPDLPVVLAKSALLLRNNGSLRVSIPNEGTILWKMGTWITGAEYKRLYGLNYQVLMKYEHVNTANEIEELLKYFFKTTRTKVFGISRKLAFYRFIHCEEPEIEKAAEYLAKNNKR